MYRDNLLALVAREHQLDLRLHRLYYRVYAGNALVRVYYRQLQVRVAGRRIEHGLRLS